MRAHERQQMRVGVDGYTRVCLTVIALLLGVLIVGLWGDRGPSPGMARAEDKVFLDSSAQRKAIIKAQETTNAKLDQLIALLRSGDVKVRLVDGQPPDGGGKHGKAPAAP